MSARIIAGAMCAGLAMPAMAQSIGVADPARPVRG